ncbi:hypothetical protein PUN28_014948 [Cardiocondyla obscurior]|uniref:Uncharacterized protein n=1 Tax=Cardiocondyla obscurior TaxID=286306 RepID=A0AAW2EW74_9HYME
MRWKFIFPLHVGADAALSRSACPPLYPSFSVLTLSAASSPPGARRRFPPGVPAFSPSRVPFSVTRQRITRYPGFVARSTYHSAGGKARWTNDDDDDDDDRAVDRAVPVHSRLRTCGDGNCGAEAATTTRAFSYPPPSVLSRFLSLSLFLFLSLGQSRVDPSTPVVGTLRHHDVHMPRVRLQNATRANLGLQDAACRLRVSFTYSCREGTNK